MDDQTWHDLALDAVFDQLNYTQSSLGAEALYQKMRLLEFQPQDQLHDLEAFFEEHPDLRLKVQGHFQPTGQEEPQHGAEHCRKSWQALCRFALYLALACLPIVLCLLPSPLSQLGPLPSW